MKNNFRHQPSSLILLSRLWLHEPDDDTINRSHTELGLPLADLLDLASAYTDLFLLNVYPYGTVFTDPDGELNGADARQVAALYEAHDYHPIELMQVGAPDHVGLCLGFLAHAEEMRLEIRDFVPGLLEWSPVCCLAVEREPAAHPFYHALAVRTREDLLVKSVLTIVNGASHIADYDWQYVMDDKRYAISNSRYAIRVDDDEIRLRDIVRFFLAPARCGMFLSRSRLGQLARKLGMRLPFGSRFDVAKILFEAAGESGLTTELVRMLSAEIEEWAAAYRTWATEYPAWQPFAKRWLARLDGARQMLALMREALEKPLELETHDIADFDGVL